jgi:putative membrane protein (TIGR04086 family)
MKNVAWKAAVGGAVTGWICTALGVLGAVAGGAWLHWTSGSRTIIATVFGIVGCLLGGFRSGLLQRSAPLSNGGAAGALTAIPLALIGLIQDPKRIIGALFAVFLGACVGTFGGMVSNGSARPKA